MADPNPGVLAARAALAVARPAVPFAGANAAMLSAFNQSQRPGQSPSQTQIRTGYPFKGNVTASQPAPFGLPGFGQTQPLPVSPMVQMPGTLPEMPNPADSCKWVLDHIARQEAGHVIGLFGQQLPPAIGASGATAGVADAEMRDLKGQSSTGGGLLARRGGFGNNSGEGLQQEDDPAAVEFEDWAGRIRDFMVEWQNRIADCYSACGTDWLKMLLCLEYWNNFLLQFLAKMRRHLELAVFHARKSTRIPVWIKDFLGGGASPGPVGGGIVPPAGFVPFPGVSPVPWGPGVPWAPVPDAPRAVRTVED